MKIRYVSDITKYTSKIKFPIILYVSNQCIKIETIEFLIGIIIKLYQRNYPIEKLKYEEIEYIEFEEIIE